MTPTTITVNPNVRQIRFSHFYEKMPRDYEKSKLLAVLPVRLEALGPDFILYDTTYHEDGRDQQYPLPAKGDYMILLLQAGSGCGHLWTTVRSQKGKGGRDKLAYYRSMIGEVFVCEVV